MDAVELTTSVMNFFFDVHGYTLTQIMKLASKPIPIIFDTHENNDRPRPGFLSTEHMTWQFSAATPMRQWNVTRPTDSLKRPKMRWVKDEVGKRCVGGKAR